MLGEFDGFFERVDPSHLFLCPFLFLLVLKEGFLFFPPAPAAPFGFCLFLKYLALSLMTRSFLFFLGVGLSAGRSGQQLNSILLAFYNQRSCGSSEKT